MKAKILKTVLPAFVLMLAVFSAFAFKRAENKALLALENGWINLSGQPCHVQVQCDNTTSPFVCKAVYNGVEHQAYGKVNPKVMSCTKILYRLP